MPALLATEVALLFASAAGGWLPQKLLAWTDVWRSLPRLIGERRAIQRHRKISTADFAVALTPHLDSPYLGRAARSRVLDALLRAYWHVVARLVR